LYPHWAGDVVSFVSPLAKVLTTVQVAGIVTPVVKVLASLFLFAATHFQVANPPVLSAAAV